MPAIILAAPITVAVAPPEVVITYGDHVINPKVINGYESKRESGNLTHQILGREADDITLRPAKLRTGTLRLVFDDEFESSAAEKHHAESATVFKLLSEVRATVEMIYIPNGAITRTLDAATSRAWILSVDFQEVAE